MTPGFDGVMGIAVISDPVAHGGTPRRKVTPLLLPRLGAPGSWPVRAVAEGVAAAPPCLWGVRVRAVLVGSGCNLGWLGERSTVPRCRALSLLLEGDVEELLHLVQPLIGLWVWRVRYVFQVAGGGCHVVCYARKANIAGSPHAGVVVIAVRVHGSWPCKV